MKAKAEKTTRNHQKITNNFFEFEKSPELVINH